MLPGLLHSSINTWEQVIIVKNSLLETKGRDDIHWGVFGLNCFLFTIVVLIIDYFKSASCRTYLLQSIGKNLYEIKKLSIWILFHWLYMFCSFESTCINIYYMISSFQNLLGGWTTKWMQWFAVEVVLTYYFEGVPYWLSGYQELEICSTFCFI